MIITELKAENYRSYSKETKYLPREGINTIVGENNVGKSNLLKIIQDIIDVLKENKTKNIESYQGNDMDVVLECKCKLDDQDIEFLLPLFSLTPRFKNEFKSTFGTEIIVKYRFSSLIGETTKILMGDVIFHNRRIFLKQTQTEGGYHPESWESFARRVVNEKSVLSSDFYGTLTGKNNVMFETNNPLNQFFGELFSKKCIIFPEFRERSTSEVQEGIFSSPQGSQVAAVLHNLKNGDLKQRAKFKKIQDYFKEIFPNLHLDIRQGEIVIVKSDEHEVGLNSIGAGIVEIIILLTHLIEIKNHVIILDEPELHLHPHAKRLVSELIKDAGKDNQIISVTHSTHFIFTEKLYQITLIRDEQGVSKLTNMPKGVLTDDEFKKIKRLTESEQKEFFFAQAVLLVEGDTERGAIPIFAKNVGFNLDLYNISVISLDGHDFSLFSKLLNGFKIPHVVMLDFDTLENIVTSIQINGQKINTSSLIRQLDDLKLLSENEKRTIQECKSEIIAKRKDMSVYTSNAIEKLIPIIDRHNFIYLLSSDFEGLFSTSEHKKFMIEAKKEFKKNKVLVGMHFAENVGIMPKEIYYGLATIGRLVDVDFEPYMS